jgi:hypothetical protein
MYGLSDKLRRAVRAAIRANVAPLSVLTSSRQSIEIGTTVTRLVSVELTVLWCQLG